MVFKSKARHRRTKFCHKKTHAIKVACEALKPNNSSDVDLALEDALEALLLLRTNVPATNHTPRQQPPPDVEDVMIPSQTDVETSLQLTPVKNSPLQSWPLSPKGVSPWRVEENVMELTLSPGLLDQHTSMPSTPRQANSTPLAPFRSSPIPSTTPTRVSPRQARRNLNFTPQENVVEVRNLQQDLWDDVQPLPQELPTNNSNDTEQDNECRCIWKSECPTCTPPSIFQGPSIVIQEKVKLPVILDYKYCVQLEEDMFFQLCGLTPSQFTFLLDFLGREEANHLKYRYDRRTPKKAMEDSNQRQLSLEDRLLMTLMRLRKGWDVRDLGLFYGVGVAAASTIINTWIRFMYFQMKRVESAMFVSRHQQSKTELPKVFKTFPNFRVCIDTTEVRIEVPTDFDQQGNSYSDYKAGNVILYLIGISGWGGVSFVSNGFEGSMSDQEIYRRSGIRKFLEKGDLILADRGFAVQEECDEDEVVLLHPPFLSGRDKFTPEEEQLTKEIAHARIFVEHIIRKIKVWDVVKHVHNTTLARLDQIMFVIGFLVNLQPPHIIG